MQNLEQQLTAERQRGVDAEKMPGLKRQLAELNDQCRKHVEMEERARKACADAQAKLDGQVETATGTVDGDFNCDG